MPRIAVIEHQQKCPPALFGDWLTEAGADLDVVRPYEGDPLPDLTSYDGVLVLGGEMSANDDDTVAWLGPLKEQLRALAQGETPVLGICLGHQLIATALGGRVTPNPHGQTVGLTPIGWSADAGDDPLFGGLGGAERSVHWNGDVVVEQPAGTVPLAHAPDGALQAARFAPHVWGIQAHPEATAAVVGVWAEGDRERHALLGIDQVGALEAIDAARDELASHWRPVAARFASLCGATSGEDRR